MIIALILQGKEEDAADFLMPEEETLAVAMATVAVLANIPSNLESLLILQRQKQFQQNTTSWLSPVKIPNGNGLTHGY